MEQIAQGSQALDNVLHPTRCKVCMYNLLCTVRKFVCSGLFGLTRSQPYHRPSIHKTEFHFFWLLNICTELCTPLSRTKNNTQVDKLVRVRRLLDRLGFLNELPERLEVMINHRHYKEAVQLYNKTISVLTRHSHVLSFKKIKVCAVCYIRSVYGLCSVRFLAVWRRENRCWRRELWQSNNVAFCIICNCILPVPSHIIIYCTLFCRTVGAHGVDDEGPHRQGMSLYCKDCVRTKFLQGHTRIPQDSRCSP